MSRKNRVKGGGSYGSLDDRNDAMIRDMEQALKIIPFIDHGFVNKQIKKLSEICKEEIMPLTVNVYIKLCSFLDEALGVIPGFTNPFYYERNIRMVIEKYYPKVALVLTIRKTVQDLKRILTSNELTMERFVDFDRRYVPDSILEKNLPKKTLLSELLQEKESDKTKIQEAIDFMDLNPLNQENLDKLLLVTKDDLSHYNLDLRTNSELVHPYKSINSSSKFNNLHSLHQSIIRDRANRTRKSKQWFGSRQGFGPNNTELKGNWVERNAGTGKHVEYL
jgi:hypothetical protein